MTSYVVTEGVLAEQVLSLLLQRMLPGRHVVLAVGKGKSNAVSLARSLLAVRKEPLALVLDADTVDPDLLREQRDGFETMLGLVAVPSLWTVALFEPELERCFFRDPAFAERLFGGPLSERQRVLSEYAPKRALDELSRERWNVEPTAAELLRRLAPQQDLAPLALEPAIRDTLRFLEAVSERSAA